MKVYFNGNFWGHGKAGKPLKAVRLGRSFAWEELEVFLPAVYVGVEGAVLDLCIRIPVDRLERFLRKWSQEKRLSCLSQEEYEDMERDNPCSLDFSVGLSMNGRELEAEQRCAIVWHPLKLEGEEEPSGEAVGLRASYDCDPDSGWKFVRCHFQWKNGSVTCPEKIKLTFTATPVPLTAGYFTTCGDSCAGREITVIHPVTQTEYTLTLGECREGSLKKEVLASISTGDRFLNPARYQLLTYRLSPETAPGEFQIQDCADSDRPLEKAEDPAAELSGSKEEGPAAEPSGSKEESPAAEPSGSKEEGPAAELSENNAEVHPGTEKAEALDAAVPSESAGKTCFVIGRTQGPTAVFLAGKAVGFCQRTAASSLHFEPPAEVRWRIIFLAKLRRDMETEFSVSKL